MARFFRFLSFLAVLALGVGWWLTAPDRVDPDVFATLQGDKDRGAQVFCAGGCASCHSAPDAAAQDAPILVGGRAFVSDFGTFYAPNISPGPQGLDGWSLVNLADALTRGVSPSGRHYYPAFPYTAYRNIRPQDLADLYAFLQTLPVSDAESRRHDVGFPFNIRRGLGLWKLLFFTRDWALEASDNERGRYLVEALGHCTECHTPRNLLGALRRDQWLAGAPHPAGKGKIPNITPGRLDWTEADIVFFLQTGLKPDFDSAGGEMAMVVKNLAKLPEDDLAAIAAYLKAVPAIGN